MASSSFTVVSDNLNDFACFVIPASSVCNRITISTQTYHVCIHPASRSQWGYTANPLPRYRLALPPLAHSLRERACGRTPVVHRSARSSLHSRLARILPTESRIFVYSLLLLLPERIAEKENSRYYVLMPLPWPCFHGDLPFSLFRLRFLTRGITFGLDMQRWVVLIASNGSNSQVDLNDDIQ
jgi:hypothetical protein